MTFPITPRGKALNAAVTTPSATMWEKWSFYRNRYGTLHAASRFVGQNAPLFWQLAGPIVTRRYRAKWSASPEQRILDLGGGSNCLIGCLTGDIDPRADVYLDITGPLPFDESSVDGIFCEEVIEHITKAQGVVLLRECYRVLRRGGKIRLSTPDLDQTATEVLADRLSCDVFNSNFYDHGHRYLYTRAALSQTLSDAGFVNVRLSSYKDGKSALGHLDSHFDRFGLPGEISQFQEATRAL